jgi:hypothetical protein
MHNIQPYFVIFQQKNEYLKVAWFGFWGYRGISPCRTANYDKLTDKGSLS